MVRLTTLFSRRCCGGPVVVLSLAFALLGMLFALMSAAELGGVFAGIGCATLGLCLLLGQRQCGPRYAKTRPE